MKTFSISISLLFLGMIMAQPVLGQNYEKKRQEILLQQEQTRLQIEKINQLIQKYTQQLGLTSQKYDEIYEDFQELKRTIALETDKIEKLETKQKQIENEIAVTRKKQKALAKKLDQLIENYKGTLKYLYKNSRTSRLALILAANSLNQMIVRNFYLKKFENYREKQVADIKQTQKDLEQSKEQLTGAYKKNEEVLAQIILEKDKLEKKKERQQNNVKLLKQNKVQIKDKLQQSKEQKQALNGTLTSLITRAEELQKARMERLRKLEAERKRKLAEAKNIENEVEREREVEKYDTPIQPVGFLSDARFAEIASNFAAEKGELPWPVASHTVSKHYGRYRHPVYGTYTENLGIEIVTEPRSPVKVVAPGQVFAIQPITGYGTVVFVSHGTYKTAYGNLSQITVQKNSILKAGDIIGYSGDKRSALGSTVFFMLRGGDKNLDPEDWLR